ncbi:MAG: DUF4175 domain-containing protein [Flavobacteriales bacterium]|nr:MAG: DUF4175 domain-containing protein [Flavobacteriales bacterium]
MPTNYHILLEKLDEFIRKYYKNQLIKGALYSIALVLGFYLAIILLEYYGQFDTGARTGLFYAFVLSTGFVLVKFVFIPMLKIYKLGETISREQAAQIIGNHFPEVQDRLLNTLQLQALSSELRTQNSELITASINQKITELKPVLFTSVIDFSENKKYLKYALPPVLLLLVILLSSPNIITDSTERLVKHRTYYEKQAPFQFIIENKTLEAVQQDDFELQVRMEGHEIPQNVYIEFENNRFKLRKENTIAFNYLFKNIHQNTTFQLFADEFYSKEYELTALPNPIILNFDVSLDYPDYVEKKDEQLKNTGDLVVPQGTKINWVFKTKNTEHVRIAFKDTTHVLNMSGEDVYSFSSRFMEGSVYSVSTENQFLKSRDSITYAINVIPDLHPAIEVEERADSLNVKRLYFRGMIKDDYGFKKLSFDWTFVNRKGKNSEPNKQHAESIPINSNSTQDQFFHAWDLSQIEIKAGDEIEYYFEVWDNDAVNGSKSTRSKINVFKAPTLDEISDKKEKTNKKIKDDLEESITEAQNLQEELKKLKQRLVDKKRLNWEDKKQIENVLNRQKELERKLEETKQHNSRNLQQQLEYSEMNERILEKQKKLQELFEQIMTDEMKQLFEKMEKLLDQMDKNKLQEMLDDMELSNKDIEKELDRTLEIFKQLEFEQKLQETIDKLDELAKEEEELSKESEDKKSDSEKLKENQDELNKDFDDLKKDMKDLEKKNSELEFPNKMENTDSEQEEIQEQMQKSSEELQQGKNKKAAQMQKQASESMKKLSKKLQEMQMSMQAQSNTEDLDNMRQLLENLVQLSFDQEDLMGQLKGVDQRDPKYVTISQQQKKLKDDAKMIEDSLFALSKRVIQIESIVNREISAINQNMEKAIKQISESYAARPHMEKQAKALASSRQQLVMTSLNNLALLFDEIIQQMMQQMSSKKYGNMSCNKPGSGMPSPASMKQLQQQLNKQIQKLKDQMEKKGNSPNGKIPQRGQMSEQLAKLAAEQEALRNQLGKLSEQMSEEKGAGGKGNLEEIQKLMEETETDLVNRRITQETLKRQQEILTRLLESERADREREMDEKRESREAKSEHLSNPEAIFEYNRKKQQEAELLKTVPPTLNLFYKNKVNEYFDTFE